MLGLRSRKKTSFSADSGFEALPAEIIDDDPGAGLGQLQRNTATDAATGASDEDDLAGEQAVGSVV